MESLRSEIVVLLPVYNDWKALGLLLAQLDPILRAEGITGSYLIVDDGSTDPAPDSLARDLAGATIRRLRLRRNVGHQRAITIGLTYLYDDTNCQAVLVMDADGQDRPEDVPLLVRRFRESDRAHVVFAGRSRRSESLMFRLGYLGFRAVHRALTGLPVRVGNFSLIGRGHLDTLVVVSELWNHYAAAVVRARIPYEIVDTVRGDRLAGETTMNMPALLAHGISAISVYADTVGARLIAGTGAFTVGALALVGTVLGVFKSTGQAIPVGIVVAMATLLILAAQAVTLACGAAFFTLTARSNLNFLPIRDYRFFVGEITDVGSSG